MEKLLNVIYHRKNNWFTNLPEFELNLLFL